jgi:hypothetical protein
VFLTVGRKSAFDERVIESEFCWEREREREREAMAAEASPGEDRKHMAWKDTTFLNMWPLNNHTGETRLSYCSRNSSSLAVDCAAVCVCV